MQLPINDHRAATMTAELIWINASPSELDIRIVEFFRSKSKGDTVTKAIYGLCLLSSILILSATVPERVALAQSDSATSESTSGKTAGRKRREERRAGRSGDAARGAVGGALVGAALGAIVGEAGMGAAFGAASGSAYMYDQSRQDDRTQMLAESIGGGQSASTGAQGAATSSTGDRGRRRKTPNAGISRGLENEYLGPWERWKPNYGDRSRYSKFHREQCYPDSVSRHEGTR